MKPLLEDMKLIKMITPPGGIVLDPFCGSGSTLVAARDLGFGYIGIDLNPEYCEIARGRLRLNDKKLYEYGVA